MVAKFQFCNVFIANLLRRGGQLSDRAKTRAHMRRCCAWSTCACPGRITTPI